jgi:Zn-dependent M16 (insulinase) family peptidase
MITTGFVLRSHRPVPALGLEVETWAHPCGAVHHHLACADEHRAFVVAFRTPPTDSTGLPHILEHTTLCGSRRFPVRDPFFQMLRRSLQTFMNALTFPDMTCYPFSSQVAKDYDNLLGVYLDAVFAPLLDPLDFSQEGHRLEPAGAAWQRKGVVFNEMKGAMDGTGEQLGMATARALLPDTCYRHNSGGEPADIPRLAYADLVAFHRRCYCPANACFVTYGDQPATVVQARIAAYLAGNPGTPLPPPLPQPSLTAPETVEVNVPWGENQDILDVSATALTWAWGDVADLDEALTGELIDRLLLGHAGAPLRLALENSGLGRSISGSGYGGSYRTGLFTAELSGIDPKAYDRHEGLVLGCLAGVARDGIPAAEIAAAMHQLELARREIRGDHFPYGLELAFRLLSPWNYGADPLPFLDQAPAIDRLRERSARPGFINEELRRRLLDNPHRAWLKAKPDRDFHARQQAVEQQQVETEIGRLDEAGKNALRQQAERLAKRQARQDDPAVLPDLELTDVPAERRWAVGEERPGRLTVFAPGTNGLLHQLVALPLPALTEAEWDLLPLLTQTFGHLGVGAVGYAERAAQLNARCGGLWAWTELVADPDDLGRMRALLFCEVKGLASRHADFAELVAETLHRQRFNEHDRLRELIEQALQSLQERVQGAGHALAGRAASRGFGGAAATGHRLGGLGRLAWLKRLAPTIAEGAPSAAAALASLADGLAALQSRIAANLRYLAVIGDAAKGDEVLSAVRQAWSQAPAEKTVGEFPPPAAFAVAPTAFTTPTAVSYCALAFPTVPFGHADAAALAVAGRLLTNNVLHLKIREQGGAYGAGASYTGGTGAFTLTSYRDPRLAATLADMRDGLKWLSDCPDEARLLKEAVLGVIAGLDAPGSPAGEARMRFTADLRGAGPARLNAFRRQILGVRPDDVRQAAHRWLPANGGTAAAITSPEALAASGLGWESQAI